MISVGTPLLWGIFTLFVITALSIDFFVLRQQRAPR